MIPARYESPKNKSNLNDSRQKKGESKSNNVALQRAPSVGQIANPLTATLAVIEESKLLLNEKVPQEP